MGLTDNLLFNALLLEGDFNTSAVCGGFYCFPAVGQTAIHVEDALKPYLGQRVRFAAHHLPAKLPAPPTGNEKSERLFSVSAEGVLRNRLKPKTEPHSIALDSLLLFDWYLELFDGSTQPLDLIQLNRHHGRLACVSVVDAEKMRDIVTAAGLDVLGVQAQELSGFAQRFKKVVKDGKVE